MAKRKSPGNNSRSQDIHDSKQDAEKLKADKSSLDLPDAHDIPGQEHIHVPPLGELGDTTISSDDEEGRGVFEDDPEDETEIVMGSEADVSADDKAVLETPDNLDVSQKDDREVMKGFPDSRDNEGERLNESINVSGSDLDTSGIEEDDVNENIGEEDEENNRYSLGGDNEQEQEGSRG